MKWKTKITQEKIPLPGGSFFEVEIEELHSLEETIDALFLELARTGDESLLEDLCPYFGCVWPAARALTEYLALHSVESEGAVRVLEVGCGLAIPSLFLAQTVKFSKVTATDFHPEVPKFLERNCERNEVPPNRFEYRELNWREPPSDLGPFGVVIGSDILYEKSHPGDVAEALVKLVKPSGRIVIADPKRPYLETFVLEMKARGFGADPVQFQVPNPPAPLKEVLVYDFKRID